MNSYNGIVRVVGVLFLIQMITAVISYSVILEPIFASDQYLSVLYAMSGQVRMAMFMDFICGACVFGIAVLLFPILRQHNERIALWYTGLRLTEWITLTISGILLLTSLSIGKELANETSLYSDSFLYGLSKFIINARGNTQNLSLLGYCLGASMFYYLLYRTKLVPRFIAVWGLIAVVLLCSEIVSNILGTSLGGMMIMMPMGFNEVFLGIWLIFKGFGTDAAMDLTTS